MFPDSVIQQDSKGIWGLFSNKELRAEVQHSSQPLLNTAVVFLSLCNQKEQSGWLSWCAAVDGFNGEGTHSQERGMLSFEVGSTTA